MGKLKDLRHRFPQYSDMSDSEFADAIYRKFYGNMPRSEFDQKTRESPALIDYTNQGIAASLGAPVDFTTAALNLIPGVDIVEPVGGSESIRKGMRAIGADPDVDGPPQTFPEEVAQGVGEAAGFLVPAGLAVKGVSKLGAGVVPSAARTVWKGMVEHPAATAASEIMSGAGMGAARYGAKKKFPDNPSAQFLAEFAGGVIGGGIPAIAPALSPLKHGSRAAKRGLGKITSPFTEAGARYRASNRLRELSADPEKAAQKVSAGGPANLSPATRTGERRLMALEQAVLDADPVKDALFLRQTEREIRRLRDSLGIPGDIEKTRRFLSGRFASLNEKMNKRLTQAADNAKKRLEALDPAERLSAESTIVREEIEKALTSARAQEDLVWNKVPDEFTVEMDVAIKAYDDILEGTPTAQLEDIPLVARNMLHTGGGAFIGRSATIKEARGLRSKLLEVARKSRASGEYNQARIADDLADALLESMGAKIPETEQGQILADALAFSRQVKERFRQGVVGRILGKERTGGASVPPASTLDVSVGRGKAKGADAVDRVFAASPNTMEAMERYVTRQFVDAAVDANGKIVTARANKWVVANEDVLDRFPELKKRISDAVDAQSTVGLREKSMGQRRQALEDPKQSAAALFLGARPGDEINSIFRSPNPAEKAKQLFKQASKDTTGEAVAGLKSAFVDDLMERCRTGGVDASGERMLSGRLLMRRLRHPKTRRVYSSVFSMDEIARMEAIARELSLLEARGGNLPKVRVMNDRPNSFMRLVAGIVGAQAGRKLAGATGGGTVQTPYIVSERAKSFVSKLTVDRAEQLLRDAIEDKELFRALLSKVDPPKKPGAKDVQSMAFKRLNSWLLALPGDDRYGRDQ